MRGRPISAALVLLAAVVLIARPDGRSEAPAPAPAAPAPAVVATADVVDPATAAPVRMITYNVCGAYRGNPEIPGDRGCRSPYRLAEWVAEVRGQVTAWDSDVVMLQELCFGQWAALRAALPGYQPVWSTVQNSAGCDAWSSSRDRRFGLGVFVRSATPVTRFATLLTLRTPVDEQRGVLCARGPVDGRPTLACAAHLSQQGYGPDNGAGQVLALASTWAEGAPVILGADLNAQPADPAATTIRGGGQATGPFVEVDDTDKGWFTPECLAAGSAECRSGEPTSAGSVPAKIDHIFVTSDDFQSVQGDAIDTDLGQVRPDHRLLRGAAAPR